MLHTKKSTQVNGNERGIKMPNTPSPLRYPGGKAKLYSFVRSILVANGLIGETYIEPFAGGAGLAIKLLLQDDVKRIVLNDYDYAIYTFWDYVLHHSHELIDYLSNVQITIDEWEKQRRVYLNQSDYSAADLAKAVLFLNRTNISGVITGGVIGGKEQTGKYKLDVRFNRDDLARKIQSIAQRANRVDLYNLDAQDFLANNLRHYYKVLINFDPPYVEKGGQLYKNSFTLEGHRALRDSIAKCKRRWIVTYDMCEEVAALYGAFRGGTIDTYYSAKDVRRAQEYVFYSNNLILPDAIQK